jgi:hypothetical protein
MMDSQVVIKDRLKAAFMEVILAEKRCTDLQCTLDEWNDTLDNLVEKHSPYFLRTVLRIDSGSSKPTPKPQPKPVQTCDAIEEDVEEEEEANGEYTPGSQDDDEDDDTGGQGEESEKEDLDPTESKTGKTTDSNLHKMTHSSGTRWTDEEDEIFIRELRKGKTVKEIHAEGWLPQRTESAMRSHLDNVLVKTKGIFVKSPKGRNGYLYHLAVKKVEKAVEEEDGVDEDQTQVQEDQSDEYVNSHEDPLQDSQVDPGAEPQQKLPSVDPVHWTNSEVNTLIELTNRGKGLRWIFKSRYLPGRTAQAIAKRLTLMYGEGHLKHRKTPRQQSRISKSAKTSKKDNTILKHAVINVDTSLQTDAVHKKDKSDTPKKRSMDSYVNK